MSNPKIIKKPEQIRADDSLIALMGPTGAGKSHFIDCLTKSTKWSGASLKPCTRKVCGVRIRLFDRNVVLVDTPTFDDGEMKDLTVLELIGEWLKKTYEQDIKLTGMLYFHRITDTHMSGTALHNWRIFRKICGDNFSEKVIFVTTMWDKIHPERGRQREVGLSKIWQPMLVRGAKIDRFLQNNSQNIVRRLIGSNPQVTSFQEEIVTLNRCTGETEAGKELDNQMQPLQRHGLVHLFQRKPVT